MERLLDAEYNTPKILKIGRRVWGKRSLFGWGRGENVWAYLENVFVLECLLKIRSKKHLEIRVKEDNFLHTSLQNIAILFKWPW